MYLLVNTDSIKRNRMNSDLCFHNRNQTSRTCPAHRREFRQFKIRKDFLHLHTMILSPDTLEIIKGWPLLPGFKYLWIGARDVRERERFDFDCPSGVKEERDVRASAKALIEKPNPSSRTMQFIKTFLIHPPCLCYAATHQRSLYIHLYILVYPSRRITYSFVLYNKSTRRVLRCKAKALAWKIIVRESIAPTY